MRSSCPSCYEKRLPGKGAAKNAIRLADSAARIAAAHGRLDVPHRDRHGHRRGPWRYSISQVADSFDNLIDQSVREQRVHRSGLLSAAANLVDLALYSINAQQPKKVLCRRPGS